MESQTVDPVGFRDGQRQQWKKGAEGWRKRSDFIDAATAHVSKRMVELAGVESGSRVIDVAAGYGEPEAEAAARRVRGFLVLGSRMVISSWGPPERVPFIAVPMGTAMRTLGVDPPPPGTPGPLSRPTPEALGGLLEGGGFSDVEVEETEVSFEWESAAELVAMVKDTVPPLVAMIEKNAPDNPDEAWNAILEAVEKRASDDGTVKFSNLVLLAVGRA